MQRPGHTGRKALATKKTLLQHIIIQSPFLKQPVQLLSETPRYWLENDGTMSLHPSHRWKSEDTIAWLRKQGLHSVPNSIKAEIGDIVYNGPKQNAPDDSTAFAPPQPALLCSGIADGLRAGG